jgi:hypothetical protein
MSLSSRHPHQNPACKLQITKQYTVRRLFSKLRNFFTGTALTAFRLSLCAALNSITNDTATSSVTVHFVGCFAYFEYISVLYYCWKMLRFCANASVLHTNAKETREVCLLSMYVSLSLYRNFETVCWSLWALYAYHTWINSITIHKIALQIGAITFRL